MIGLIACIVLAEKPIFVPYRTIPGDLVREGSRIWEVQYRRAEYVDSEGLPIGDTVNSMRVLLDRNEVLEFHKGGALVVIRANTPAPFPVFLVKSHSWAGHGENTFLFGIRNGRFLKMLDAGYGEIGGPIYRDFDHDGTMEWVFDDYDWYTHERLGPENYIVYKLSVEGKLGYWKTFENRKRQGLPRDSRFVF